MNLLAGDLGGTKTILAIFSNDNYPKKLFEKYYISSEWKSFYSIFEDFIKHLPDHISLPEMAYCLKGLLDRFEKEGRPNLQENIAITCIRYDKQSPSSSSGFGTGWNTNKNFYPASVVKIVYALATQVWLQQDLIVNSEELKRALHEMIANSNNDATGFILDLLTGTTSGPSLNESNYQGWKIQRQLINAWLNELRWPKEKMNDYLDSVRRPCLCGYCLSDIQKTCVGI